ncbi:MAG: O-linked N-acetylglucosamine transferase [Roseomonas sp.]|nr:O-linked N-acetylglucosamine transferase [Roseomonas sp.]
MHQARIADLIAAAQSMPAADAITAYRGWIAARGDDPLLYAAAFNLAVLLEREGLHEEAAEAHRLAAQRNPGFLPPFISIGLAHERRGEVVQALEHWHYVANALQAVTRDGIANRAGAMKQMARLQEDLGAFAQAEDGLRQLLEIDPTQRDVLQRWLSLRQRRCAWPLLEPPASMTKAALLRDAAPLTLANMTEDAMLLLAHAAACIRREAPMPPDFQVTMDFAAQFQRAGRRRIGYLSSDLRDHAVGHLTADLFRHHDREAFEIFVYDCGIAREDATKGRIRASVEHWRDIIALDDDAALRLMRDDGIDILVDLNGHTRGGRLGLLARRPAPVIVNWLGFAGTMGSPFHHYIIADDMIVPPGREHSCSEVVRRLPCYQPNDRHRLVNATPPRGALGLPEDAFVFCCFNGMQKITRFVFDRWMAILRATPGSVLWLIQGGAEAEAALRGHAEAAGIDPARLIFAPPLRNADHVARYGAADLFLDTWPYGAHTTASDCLWMGTPILTVPGQSFASRVCGSLVKAAGLGDFLCRDWDDYARRAIALAANPAPLAEARARLLAGRMTSVLFDTEALVRALEGLFRGMWRDATSGRLPRPDLTNLAEYLEIGATFPLDGAAPADAAALAARWRDALARRDAFSPLGADQRLWPRTATQAEAA